MAVLGLRFCARAFSSCGKRGPLFIAAHGPLSIAASVIAEHRLQTRRLSNCGSRAQLLRGVWDLPRPGLEPVSPALAGRLSTTAPPGKPQHFLKACFTLSSGFFPKPLIPFLQTWLCKSSGWAITIPKHIPTSDLLKYEKSDFKKIYFTSHIFY